VATRLATAPLGWLTTVRADGQPQSSYIWFHFDGNDLLVFSEPTAAKIRYMAMHPLVPFHPDGDGSGGGAVLTVEGRAEVLAGDPAARAVRYDDSDHPRRVRSW
jgi:PPOX class probable F420-dependent enzyme